MSCTVPWGLLALIVLLSASQYSPVIYSPLAKWLAKYELLIDIWRENI